jgi:hypothetical protein
LIPDRAFGIGGGTQWLGVLPRLPVTASLQLSQHKLLLDQLPVESGWAGVFALGRGFAPCGGI